MTFIPIESSSTGKFSSVLSFNVSGSVSSGNITASGGSQTLGPESGLTQYSLHTFIIYPVGQYGRLRMQWLDGADALIRQQEIEFKQVSGSNELGHTFSFKALTDKVKIVLFNDGLSDAAIRCECRHYKNCPPSADGYLDEKIGLNSACVKTRAMLMGETPDGKITNVALGHDGEFKSTISGPLGVFGDLATHVLHPVFNQIFANNSLHGDFWSTRTGTGGTVTATSGMCNVDCTASSGSFAMLESKTHIKYYGGIGILARYTAIFQPTANNLQITGIGHDTSHAASTFDKQKLDGFHFGTNGTVFGIYIAYSDTNDPTFIPQSSWNLDKADGSGSLPLIDITKGNVYEIQFQYLGFGAVVFSIENPDTGDFYDVHIFKAANSRTFPSLMYPTLPFSVVNYNEGAAAICSVKTASCGLFYEGKPPIRPLHFSVASTASVDDTIDYHIISISPTSHDNDILLSSLSIVNGTSANQAEPVLVKIMKNIGPSLTTWTGGTLTYAAVAPTYSSVNKATDVVTTPVSSTMYDVLHTVAAPSTTVNLNLSPYNIHIREGEEVHVVGRIPVTGTAQSVTVSLSYREEY